MAKLLGGTTVYGALSTMGSISLSSASGPLYNSTITIQGWNDDTKLYYPDSFAYDLSGNLYISDSVSIRKIDSNKRATRFAGYVSSGTYTNGPLSASRFVAVNGLAFDRLRSALYVSDARVIRKIDLTTNRITTLAGLTAAVGSQDGPFGTGRFNSPSGLVVDSTCTYLYVADTTSYKIRRVDLSNGTIATIAGTGTSGRTTPLSTAYPIGSAARIGAVYDVAIDPTNSFVYFPDYTYQGIWKVSLSGQNTFTFVAGNSGGTVLYGGQDGTGWEARFYLPRSICHDGSSNLFVADMGYDTIRRVSLPAGIVTTKIGVSSGGFGYVDGVGTAIKTNNVTSLRMDPTNSKIIGMIDSNNYAFRKITIGGTVGTPTYTSSTYVGGLGNSLTNNTSGVSLIDFKRITIPEGVFTSLSSTAATITTLSSTNITGTNITGTNITGTNISGTFLGTVDASKIKGDSFLFNSPQAGTALNASFGNLIFGLAFDSASACYVADLNNNVIRKITPGGGVYTFAGNKTGASGSANGTDTEASFKSPWGLAFDSNENLIVTDSGNNTIRKITPSRITTTVAGSAGRSGNADATSFASVSGVPMGAVADGAGNTYIADSANNKIRKITPNGAVYTLAGTGVAGSVDNINGQLATLNSPTGIVYNSAGNFLCFTDSGNKIRLIPLTTVGNILAGSVITIAGTGTATSTDNATGTSATLNAPRGLAIDSAGTYLYFVESVGNRVRRMSLTSPYAVTTLAGTGTATSTDNATGTSATFATPWGICIDGTNANLFVSDTGTHKIRKVSLTAPYAVTTIAGTGASGAADNAVATSATFNSPRGLYLSTADDILYVADYSNNKIRLINNSSGALGSPGPTDSIGTGIAGYQDGDINGSNYINYTSVLPSATFTTPSGFYYTNGSLQCIDAGNGRIRSVVGYFPAFYAQQGLVYAVGTTYGAVSGTALFNAPAAISIANSTGNMYVADVSNNIFRKITPAGEVTTVAGTGSAGSVDLSHIARFNTCSSVAADSSGNVYIADSANNVIRKYTAATGYISTLAGSGTAGLADGTGTAAQFSNPERLCIDSTGANIYVSDYNTNRIRKVVTATGVVTTIAGSSAGTAGSTNNATGTSATFSGPAGIAIDSTNANLYVADSVNHLIRKVSLTSPFAVTTVAGGAGVTGTTDGIGTAARFNIPDGIAIDSSSTNMYVTDYGNHTIRKIIIASATVSTFAGTAGVITSVDGTGAAATFYYPVDCKMDTSNNIYVTDIAPGKIRKITTPGAVVTTIGYPNGGYDGNLSDGAAGVARPYGICLDSSNNIYVSDRESHRIHKIIGNNLYSLGGLYNTPGYADTPQNPLILSRLCAFNGANGILVDSTETTAYVADYLNHKIRKIVLATGVVTTLAGVTDRPGFADGTGSGALFKYPLNLVFDGAGNIMVSDQANNRIRKVTPAGVVSTYAGNGEATYIDNPVGLNATLSQPLALAYNGLGAAGSLYFTGYPDFGKIRKVATTGTQSVSSFAGTDAAGYVDSPNIAYGITRTHTFVSIASNTVTYDLTQASLFRVTLNSAITTTNITNAPVSKLYTFMLQTVGDGVQRTIAWPTSVKWTAATAPTPTLTLGKVDTFEFMTYDGGSTWYARTVSTNQ